jgi:hypothetical protein
MKPYIVFLLNLSSCAYLEEELSQDDNLFEEIAEEVIKEETGVTIDFTPLSKEK